jgi:hypothetical protein
MAGKIIADQIEHSTAGSLDTSYVVNGSAKYWVNYSQLTVTAVHDSFNHSSFTDNGTGNATVGFTNSFSNTDYSGSGMSVQEANVCWGHYSAYYLTGSNRILTQDNNANGLDEDRIGVHIMGDLA